MQKQKDLQILVKYYPINLFENKSCWFNNNIKTGVQDWASFHFIMNNVWSTEF